LDYINDILLSSVADPGCFILDSGKAPDPGSDLFFFIKAINKFCMLIPDPDPTIAPSRIRIPDPGGKKAPDPGSGFATLLLLLGSPFTAFNDQLAILPGIATTA
jgi:hypothetical protein